MDGGRRLLRSLKGFANALARTTPTLATAPQAPAFTLNAFSATSAAPADSRSAQSAPTRRGNAHPLVARAERFARSHYVGGALVFALLGVVGIAGLIQGGAYATFVAREGSIPDQIAKASGFAIKAVTITGAHEITESEILAIAGVTPRNSLVFLDVADCRARLKAIPLVKEASVSKLFPDRLLIEVEERQPYALWQKDGAVLIVAADGTPIDDLHDARFESLPLVTGIGANEKLADYSALLDAAGDLRARIRAGIYVAGRRWTLKTNAGVEIVLPEKQPGEALARLALLEHDSHILEKDVLSLDLRIPGRVVARLSAEAGAAREEALAKKAKPKGAQT